MTNTHEGAVTEKNKHAHTSGIDLRIPLHDHMIFVFT